jgi:hypothetical protein
MGISAPGQDVVMTENQRPPPIPTEEPKYGGFTRFEIELEVRTTASFHSVPFLFYRFSLCGHQCPRLAHHLTIHTVCPVSFLALLPQPSRFSEILREPRLCRLSQIPAVLCSTTVSQISDISWAHAEESGAVATGEI